MKILCLSGKFFKKHWMANILIALELALAILLATMFLNRHEYLYKPYKDYKDTPIRHSLFFMGREITFTGEDGFMDTLILGDYYDELMDKLTDFPIVKGISVYGNFYADGPVFIYDAITAGYLGLKEDVRGSWLFESDKADKYPVVVYNGGEDVKIGDQLSLTLSLNNQLRTEPEEDSKFEQKKAECEVVGTIDSLNSPILWSTIKTNDSLSLDDLFQQQTSWYVDETVYFMEYNDELFSKYRFSTDNFFIYLHEDAEAKDIAELKKMLSDYGYVQEGRHMLELSKDEADGYVMTDFAMFFTIAGIALVSLLSITFLNVKKLMPSLSVYYINGCSFKKAMRIYLLYLFAIVILAFILYLAVMGYFNYQNYQDYLSGFSSDDNIALYQFGWSIVLKALAIIAAVLVAGSYLPFSTISRKSKINMLRGN